MRVESGRAAFAVTVSAGAGAGSGFAGFTGGAGGGISFAVILSMLMPSGMSPCFPSSSARSCISLKLSFSVRSGWDLA